VRVSGAEECPVIGREPALVQETQAQRHRLDGGLGRVGVPESGIGTPQSNHSKVGHGCRTHLALETCLEGSRAEVELSGQASGRPWLGGSFLEELDRALDDPSGRPSREPDGRFAVVVGLPQQQPIEHKTLEVATRDLARGQARRLIELLRHHFQHRVESPGGVTVGHAEVEAQP
jgi:hypothetical protein